MVAAHRPKSPDFAYTHAEELSTTTESPRRSPSARDRFARYVSSNNNASSSTSRRAGNSYAARLSKPCASKDASQLAFSPTLGLHSQTDSLSHSSDAATDGSSAVWAIGHHFTSRSSSSSFSGAIGNPLQSIEDQAGATAVAAVAGGVGTDGSMQLTAGPGRFASEGRSLEPRCACLFLAFFAFFPLGPSTACMTLIAQHLLTRSQLQFISIHTQLLTGLTDRTAHNGYVCAVPQSWQGLPSAHNGPTSQTTPKFLPDLPAFPDSARQQRSDAML